jgi:hypothetical protein
MRVPFYSPGEIPAFQEILKMDSEHNPRSLAAGSFHLKSRYLTFSWLGLLIPLLATGCPEAEGRAPLKAEGNPASVQLTSSAFSEGAPIPVKYTCDGQDLSPPLRWSNLPGGTKSLALVCEDPDAPVGIWVHWVLYDIPPSLTGLP